MVSLSSFVLIRGFIVFIRVNSWFHLSVLIRSFICFYSCSFVVSLSSFVLIRGLKEISFGVK